MKRGMPWALIVTWLATGVTGWFAIPDALRRHSSALAWTLGVEALVVWALVWTSILVPRTITLTAARIGVPAAALAAALTLGSTAPLTTSAPFAVAALSALAALAHPRTIDHFVDGSSYGPERRFALRTPLLTALVAVPPTWIAVALIGLVGPLAVVGQLIPALAVGLVWVLTLRWAIRSLHLPARRWVVFVPAGMVFSDPFTLTDRVLFPRRNVAAIGPAYADTDATDLSSGAMGLALQLDLTESFEIPLLDRTSGEERSVVTDRLVFAVLRPGAMLADAQDRRFAVGATRPEDAPVCMHHGAEPEAEPEESQTAVALPKTRSPR